MKYKYVIQNGSITESQDGFVFEGKAVDIVDPNTNEIKKIPMYSAMLFPIALKSGSISFDVEFSDVNDATRCGFIFNRTYTDGIEKMFQIAIRNQMGFCSLDYYNGSNWEFLCTFGSNGQLEKGKKYSLCFSLNGNVLSFLVNEVPTLTYTKLRAADGICGIFTCSEADVTIKNVNIQYEKPTAFSIMKFEKDFDELYQEVITPTCERFGYNCIRADKCYTTSAIIKDIVKEISNASLIIADITMDNPNVFYELGFAHALGKPTILLADKNKRDRLPFDISGYRTVFYENSIGGKKEIENMLQRYIENIKSQN